MGVGGLHKSVDVGEERWPLPDPELEQRRPRASDSEPELGKIMADRIDGGIQSTVTAQGSGTSVEDFGRKGH